MPGVRTPGCSARWAAGALWLCLAAHPAAGAVLDGLVLDNQTGRPLARSSVKLESLSGMAVIPLKTVLSDSNGRFRFSALPDGAYLLAVSRGGYATTKYGQKRWNAGGSPIALEADHEFLAEVRLQRLGVITGQVLDENELGLPGHPVYAFRLDRRPVRVAAEAISDDRGIYRLTGLEPGRYAVRTGSRQLEDGRGLLPTYFGQSTDSERARTVDVVLDQEVAGIDMEPLPGRLATLSGGVSGAPEAAVYLYTDTGRREAHTDPSGGFSFDQLAPGQYLLLAQSAKPQLASFRRVAVGEAGARIQLSLSAWPSVHVRCENSAGRLGDPRRVSVFLRREQPPDDEMVQRLLGGETVSLAPGEYAAGAFAPPEYYVAAIQGSPRGGAPNTFAALPGTTLELTVVLSAHPASLSGRVLAADGQPVAGVPVYLHAVDPEVCARLTGARQVRTNDHGEYLLNGLPPGKYQIVSSFGLTTPKEEDWGALPAQVISLEEDQAAKLDVQLLGDL